MSMFVTYIYPEKLKLRFGKFDCVSFINSANEDFRAMSFTKYALSPLKHSSFSKSSFPIYVFVFIIIAYGNCSGIPTFESLKFFELFFTKFRNSKFSKDCFVFTCFTFLSQTERITYSIRNFFCKVLNI